MANLGFGGKNIIDIIKYRFVWLGLSAIFIVPGLCFMGYNMLTLPAHTPVKLGIDFTGGTFLQYAFVEELKIKDIERIRGVLSKIEQGNAIIQIQEPADILGSLSEVNKQKPTADEEPLKEEIETPQQSNADKTTNKTDEQKTEEASDNVEKLTGEGDASETSVKAEAEEVEKALDKEEKVKNEAKSAGIEKTKEANEAKNTLKKEDKGNQKSENIEKTVKNDTKVDEDISNQASQEEVSVDDSVATTSKDLDMSKVKTIVSLRVKFLNDKELKELNALLKDNFGDYSILQVSAIGPSLGKELLHNSMMALLLVFGGIVVYLSMRFQLDYAICAFITLFHDAVFVIGTFALFSILFHTEVDSLFVTAVLTVIGFSVHDTIVVFDRIRENARFLSKKKTFNEICNDSVNQTLARSINTSLTAILVLLCLYFFGGVTTKDFVLAMTIGIAVGTYSSIFVASMLLAFWRELNAPKKRRRKVTEE